MPTFFNFNKRKGVFMIPAGATKSPTPAPPSFSNTKSLAFDGVDETVSLGNISDLNGSTSASFSMWLKLNSTGIEGLFNQWGGSADRLIYAFIWLANGRMDIYMNGIRAFYVNSNPIINALSTGQWFNLIITYDGTQATSSDRVKVYIDNQELTGNTGFAGTTLNNSTTDFIIGYYPSGTYIDGNIDEFAIYNTTLSPTDISTIATAPSDLSTYNPIAWYRMGDNSTYQTPQILMPSNENKNKVSNWSLQFDGVDDYIATSSLTGLGMGTTDLISVSLWFKTNATKSFPTAFNTGGWPLTSGLNIYLDSTTNNIGVRVNNVAITTSGTNYRDNNWHHILLCYNGSLGSNQIELFVDGVSVGTNTLTGNITSTTTDIHIGANTNTSLGTFRGWEDNVDEVAIFNTDQRANISSIYNGGEPTTISGSTAYWKLGEQATFSTNWIVPDQVGSNDGTSANMTIEDRVGDAPNSSNNAVSFNMEAGDIDNDTP